MMVRIQCSTPGNWYQWYLNMELEVAKNQNNSGLLKVLNTPRNKEELEKWVPSNDSDVVVKRLSMESLGLLAEHCEIISMTNNRQAASLLSQSEA